MLCVSPRLLQPQCPGNKKRTLSTKEETFLEIILLFGHTITPIPTWNSDHVPPFSPMDCNLLHCFPIQATVQPDSSLLQIDYPPSLHQSVQVWTDGSVPSLFGPGGAGVYVTCSKCHTSNSRSFSTGPIASSFTAETFGLKQGLDWCTNHLMTCKFQSVLFLTDSQSFHQLPLISCLSPSGLFGLSPPPSPTTPS